MKVLKIKKNQKKNSMNLKSEQKNAQVSILLIEGGLFKGFIYDIYYLMLF